MKKITFLLILISVSSLLSQSNDDYYYKINKSFDIYGNIFRELSANYLIDINPEDLMKSSIDGMLSNLDPYTVYFDDKEQDDLEMFTNGTYVGFGFTVGTVDSMLTILELKDSSSAFNAGFRIGDKILWIDSTNMLYKSSSELREVTKGVPGTKSHFVLLRNNLKDTLNFELNRENIKLQNVSYFNTINNNIGYIRLDRFDKTSVDEFKKSVKSLVHKKVNGFIIDLRDNPGGLLEAAVSIIEIFVPKGSLVMSTKGRDEVLIKEYYTSKEPIVPNLPLAVLINENSASAAEIFAGAIQDLDRGIILGKRSFGKGLVQTVLPLPYNSALKITSAKYYTPSGRCIQKFNIAEKFKKKGDLKINSDTVFFTLNKRKVFESNGITPDSTFIPEKYSEIIDDLVSKQLLFKFATYYTSNWDKLPNNFEVNDKVFEEFEKYLKENKYHFDSHVFKIFSHLDSLSIDENFSKEIKKKISELEKLLNEELVKIPLNVKTNIKKWLKFEIASRFISNFELTKMIVKEDKLINSACEIINSSLYNSVISNGTDKVKNVENN